MKAAWALKNLVSHKLLMTEEGCLAVFDTRLQARYVTAGRADLVETPVYILSERAFQALQKMLAVEGDHMTACDRVMGDTHPCTCGVDEARGALE